MIKILVDSGSDLSIPDKEIYNIGVVPLSLIYNGEEWEDYYDFKSEEYRNILKTAKNLPTTSQPSPERYISYFKKFEDEYDEIMVITMSHLGSGSHNSAMLAKDIYEEEGGKARIFVVDSLSTSYGISFLAIKGMELAKKGLSGEEIERELKLYRKKLRVSFLVDDMEFLIKGGRISVVKGAFISKLQIKPIISLTDEGTGNVSGKAIGFKNGLSKLCSAFEKNGNYSKRVQIIECGALNEAESLAEAIKAKIKNANVVISEMKGVMSTHAGPGSVCIAYEEN